MGALALIAGAALLAATAFRLAPALSSGESSPTWLLLAAFTLASAELVATTLALSLFHLVTAAGLLATLAILCAATLLGTRGSTLTVGWPRRSAASLRATLGDPILFVLACAVLAGLAYVVALTLTTPQNDFDTLYDHLWRAALWRQNHAVGYPRCSCAPYIDAYPPNGEIGVLFTMVLGSSDRYVGLVQTLAYLAIVVAVVGIARRLGLPRRAALFGGLLVATLPILALEASTAQNDLLVAAFLLAATVFLLDGGPRSPWFAGLATALAMGTKVSAPFGVPLLLAAAVLAHPLQRRRARIAAVFVGSAVGAFWYFLDLARARSWTGAVEPTNYNAAAIASRTVRYGLEFIDLSGAVGRDLVLYGISAGILFVGLLVFVVRRDATSRSLRGASLALGVALSPLVLLPVAHLAVRAYLKLWLVVGRDDVWLDPGRDITRSASNYSWYGPLGSLLFVGGAIAVVSAVRRNGLDRLAALFSLAPVFWLVAFSISLFYQPYAGRFFVFPFALAAATWGIVIRARPVAWGVAAIAVTTLALTLVNDYKRPAGVELLESHHVVSIWSTARWASQGREVRNPDIVRFIDEHLPPKATIALGLTPSDNGYVFLGRGLDRRIDLIDPATRDVPEAQWAFIRPGLSTSLCETSWREVAVRGSAWTVLRRSGHVPCRP